MNELVPGVRGSRLDPAGAPDVPGGGVSREPLVAGAGGPGAQAHADTAYTCPASEQGGSF